MKAPTMVYAPLDEKLIEPGVTTETKDYMYKVVDASEVKSCKGWHGSPAELPKKRKRGTNKKVEHASEFEDVKQ